MLSAEIKYLFKNDEDKKSGKISECLEISLEGTEKKKDGMLLFMDFKTYKSLADAEEGLCYRRFKPDIVFTEELPFGKKIQIGETIFQIERHIKKCHKDCGIKDKSSCLILRGHYGFLKPLNSGIISIKNTVRVI